MVKKVTTLEKIGITLAALLLIASFFLDNHILKYFEYSRHSQLNEFMLFITDAGMYLVGLGIVTLLFIRKQYTLLLLVVAGCLASVETVWILKKTFQVPRPYFEEALGISPLAYARGYALPSLHAAFSLALVPFLTRVFKTHSAVFVVAILCFTIALSRPYLGVHYVSDILLGGIIGYTFSRFLLHLEDRHKLCEKFYHALQTKLEIRRQTAHLLSGVAIVLGLKLKILTSPLLLAMLLLGGTVSLIARKRKIPLIHPLLSLFEREYEKKRFPGKGPFFMILGSLLAVTLFEEPIALAAITIMAVGDSVTTMVSSEFGKLKSPLHSFKYIEGTGAAIILATLGAYTFVPFHQALMGTALAMTLELLLLERVSRVLDDNLLIPLIAGFAMTLVG